MTIINEEDALQSLRRAAREADTPAPVDRLSLVLNAVIPAVKNIGARMPGVKRANSSILTPYFWKFAAMLASRSGVRRRLRMNGNWTGPARLRRPRLS